MKWNNSSYEYNERLSIQNGIASTVVLNITGNYFTLFAISVLGASNYQVGLINSLPQFIGMFAMIICSIWLGKLDQKKTFTSLSVLFTRLFLVLMVFVVFLPTHYQAWVFVLLVGLMNFPGSFANLSWQSFIGDLISEERRNMFFSERNRVVTLVGMLTTLFIGITLQFFHPSNPVPYQVLFVIGVVFGVLEVYYLFKHKETKKERTVKIEKKKGLDLSVYKHKPFLYFILCGLFFNFAWQMAWSLFSIYQIKYALATGLWVSLFAVSNQIAQIISFKWWGRMADKHGNAKLLMVVALGMATAPVMNVFSTNLVYLLIVNGLSGFFVSGTVLLLFNQLLEVSKEENRSAFIAHYNVLLAFIAFVAPQAGVYLLEAFSMNVAMTTSTILRGLGAIVFYAFYVYMKREHQLLQLQPLKRNSV